jgi:D-hydroxyproline dehydrogenase subunit gamma
VQLFVNGDSVSATPGTTVAVLLAHAGTVARKSISGEARAPFCAMGICMECCATVNGIQHVRTCQIVVEPAMNVITE